jgi:hypothetical protein
MSLLLIFSMHFDRDKGLDQGRLQLFDTEQGHIDIWTATSSVDSKQGIEDFHQRGGLIPPNYRSSAKRYTVLTKPIPMPQIKGVEGNFYKINPHEVKTDKGGVRGDFGIHLDANVPGSMGCIVMDRKNFDGFEKRMKSLSLNELPLSVIYS